MYVQEHRKFHIQAVFEHFFGELGVITGKFNFHSAAGYHKFIHILEISSYAVSYAEKILVIFGLIPQARLRDLGSLRCGTPDHWLLRYARCGRVHSGHWRLAECDSLNNFSTRWSECSHGDPDPTSFIFWLAMSERSESNGDPDRN